MSYQCFYTGKKSSYGKQRTYRGQKVSKGGFGLKPTGITRRKFRPNLQRVRARVGDSVKRLRVCTRCIKSGKVLKPLRRSVYETAPKPAAPAPAE